LALRACRWIRRETRTNSSATRRAPSAATCSCPSGSCAVQPANLCPWILARGSSPKSSRPLGSLAVSPTTSPTRDSKTNCTGSYRSLLQLWTSTTPPGSTKTSRRLSSSTASTLPSKLIQKLSTSTFRELTSASSRFDDLPFPSIFISATDLKQLKFPRGATSPEFFSKDLAIFQDDCYEWKIHNPTENKSLGELDFDRLYRISQQDSIVKNKDYPGKLLFVKEWRENKVYSIDEKDFIKGDFKKHEEVKGLEFHTDITQASIFRGGDEYFWMYSCGKKLIIRNQQEDEGQGESKIL